jgi:hypothetical protein
MRPSDSAPRLVRVCAVEWVAAVRRISAWTTSGGQLVGDRLGLGHGGTDHRGGGDRLPPGTASFPRRGAAIAQMPTARGFALVEDGGEGLENVGVLPLRGSAGWPATQCVAHLLAQRDRAGVVLSGRQDAGDLGSHLGVLLLGYGLPHRPLPV